jgi:hypothetical protein
VDLHKQREAQMNTFLMKLEQKRNEETEKICSWPISHVAKPQILLSSVVKNKSPVKPLKANYPASPIAIDDGASKHSTNINLKKSIIETNSKVNRTNISTVKRSSKDEKFIRDMAEREKSRLKQKDIVRLQLEAKRNDQEAKALIAAKEKEAVEKEAAEKKVQEQKRLKLEARKIMELKEKEKQNFKAQLNIAKAFHAKSLLKYYGFLPLRKLMVTQKANINIAVEYWNNVLAEFTFREMLSKVISKQALQNDLAIHLRNRNIQMINFLNWKQVITL